MTMEQPLKKRKLYDPLPEPPQLQEPPSPPPLPPSPPPTLPPPPPQPPQTPNKDLAVSKLTQEEILRRRRNKEEIRSLHECYKRIKFSVSQKDARFTTEFEQAYLSLISASRGCSSVQRVVADLIPRYASFCPTALEAATKVIINMHNWSMAVISRGEDTDGVAFETAKACIFGLVDICQIASMEAPTSSVILGICSEVFLSVLTFLSSSFQGKDVFEIVDGEILEVRDSKVTYSKLKERLSVEDEPVLSKLSKFHALVLLRIFFCYPKYILAACFELFNPVSVSEIHNEGLYVLRQLTNKLDDSVASLSKNRRNGARPSPSSPKASYSGKECVNDDIDGDANLVLKTETPFLKNCLLRLAVDEDQSLSSWIFSKYKKLCKSASVLVVSEIKSILEGTFESFRDLVKAEDSQVDGGDEKSDPSKNISRQYFGPNGNSSEITMRDLQFRDGSHGDLANRASGSHLKHRNSLLHVDSDLRSNVSSTREGGGLKSLDFDSGEHGGLSHSGSPKPWELNNQVHSPKTAKPLENKIHSFEGGSHVIQTENRIDVGLPSSRSISAGVNCSFDVPEQANTAIVHLRRYRKEKSDHHPSPSRGSSNAVMHTDGARSMSVDSRRNNPANSVVASVHTQPLFENPADNYGTRMLRLRSLVSQLCMKHNAPRNIAGSFQTTSVRHLDLPPTNTILVSMPNVSALSITDDELMAMINLAIDNVGSVVRLTRTNMHVGACWFVECSSVDVASTILKNLHSCPEIFFQLEFSHPGKHPNTMLAKPEGTSVELASPRVNPQNHGMLMQHGSTFQSNWAPFSYRGLPDVGGRNVDGFDNNVIINPLQGGGPVVSGASEQPWMYKKMEAEMHAVPGSISFLPTHMQGHSNTPPRPVQGVPFVRPFYYPPSSSWDPRGFNYHPHLNPVSSGVRPNNLHSNTMAPPALPASVPPLVQMSGCSVPQYDHMFSVSTIPPPLHCLPPQPDLPTQPHPQLGLPSLPPHPDFPSPLPQHGQPLFPPRPDLPPLNPPPPPLSQPPLAPPPPSSPPPPLYLDSSIGGISKYPMHHQWQGTLSKSGVPYCTIFACRADSDVCKYSSSIIEPAEWPAKLDMTKRTDVQHVKSTFSSTPPHKREVCWLIPSSAGDHKGLQDFVSYLKQRECAGVIKIPAVRSMWARLLFILPYSNETCSMLSIPPNPSDCLIALVLPKETNFDNV